MGPNPTFNEGGLKVEAYLIGFQGMIYQRPIEVDILARLRDIKRFASVDALVEQMGRDVVTFRREDGVAENFKTGQNRELLEKLADQTGGRYYRPDTASQLTSDISYSEAGITTRETRDLWDMPILFLLLILLRAAEWLVRRRWGAV